MNRRTPRAELLSLLSAAKQSPDDAAPRRVLADWLEEYGSPMEVARARLIRQDGAVDAKVHGEETMAHVRAWVPPALCAYWHEGLLGLMSGGLVGQRLQSRGAWPWLRTGDAAWVEELRLEEPTARQAERVAGHPFFAHVARLILGGCAPEAFVTFAESRHASALRHLEVHYAQLGGLVEALAASHRLLQLRSLELWDCGLSAQDGAVLAASPLLARLTDLALHYNPDLGSAWRNWPPRRTRRASPTWACTTRG